MPELFKNDASRRRTRWWPWALVLILIVGAGSWWQYRRSTAAARGADASGAAAPARPGAGAGAATEGGPGGGTGAAGGPGGPGATAGAGPGAGPGENRARGGPPGAARVQPVSAGFVQRRDIRVTVAAIGSIAAANTAVVRSKIDGELKAIHFTEGQPVVAGQLVAEIDPRPFQIALNIAQGTLARDKAQLLNAQLDLTRYRDLVAKEAAPRQQLDTQAALVQQLTGTVQADQAAVDNAKLQLSYTRVIAPISGLAGLKQADLGNIVRAGDATGLLTITQTQPIAVVFAVPDTSLPRIRQQLKAGVPLPVEAWDREQKTMLAKGTVASTDNAIDAATGTIRVKALFPNTDNALFPNQFVNMRLQLDTMTDALVVRSAAIQRGAQGTFVYAANADGTVSLRPVSILATDGDWVAVQGELTPGGRVVTDGADRLRDGARIEIIEPAAGGPGSARRDGAGGGRRRAGAGGGAGAPAGGAGAPGGAAATGGAANGGAAGAAGPGGAAAAAQAAPADAALPAGGTTAR